MRMSLMEKAALAWIDRTLGCPSDKIFYSNNMSPDFIVADSWGFEVKGIYGGKKTAPHIIFHPDQRETLLKWVETHSDCFLLIFPFVLQPQLADVISMAELGRRNEYHGFTFSEEIRRPNCHGERNLEAFLKDGILGEKFRYKRLPLVWAREAKAKERMA